MTKIYGYTSMQKVVGIPPINSAQHYNNRYYRRQREREEEREKRRQEKIFEYKKQKQQSQSLQPKETLKIYKSQDPNIIYLMEYSKARNTRVYNQLNQSRNTTIIDYSSRQDRNLIGNNKQAKTKKAINEYSFQMSVQKSTVIDFETRKQNKQDVKKQEPRKKIEQKKSKKKISKKKTTNKQSAKKTTVQKQGGRNVMSKEQEMRQFKSSIKKAVEPKTDLDRAAYDFEKALREKNAYDAQLRKNGYRVIKGNRSTGRDR